MGGGNHPDCVVKIDSNPSNFAQSYQKHFFKSYFKLRLKTFYNHLKHSRLAPAINLARYLVMRHNIHKTFRLLLKEHKGSLVLVGADLCLSGQLATSYFKAALQRGLVSRYLFEDGIGSIDVKAGLATCKRLQISGIISSGAFHEAMSGYERCGIKVLEASLNSFNALDLDEKRRLCDAFDASSLVACDLASIKEVIFIQPLCEDGVMSADEYYNLLAKMLAAFPNAAFKLHPRSKVDFAPLKDILNERIVLPRLAPAELLEMLGLAPKTCITLFSTAPIFFKRSHIVYLGDGGSAAIDAAYGKFIKKFSLHNACLI